MSFPADLLEQARQLAVGSPGRPKQAAVIRAVATAYYALFHLISEETAKPLIGATNQERARRDLARRAISHSKLKDVCREFLKTTPKVILKPLWASTGIAGDSDLAAICNGIIDLQERRHTADYDLGSPIRKLDALDACDTAERAMNAWVHLRQTKPEAAVLFATAVLLWPGLSGR